MAAPVLDRRARRPDRAAPGSFGTRSRTLFRPRRVAVGVVVLALLWEAVSLLVTRGVEHPEFVMPDLVHVARYGLPGLADYYTGWLGGTPPSAGGERTWPMGLAALVEHGAISVGRILVGFVLGLAAGVLLGLLMSASRAVRNAGFGIATLLRTLPVLALGPLFTLWFGATSAMSVSFVAFAVGLVMLVATMTAVANLDLDVVRYSRSLGLGAFAVQRRVVLPAILPELGGAALVAVPLAWSVLLASEIYGIQEGLGWMMGKAVQFTLVDRITVIAVVFVLLTFVMLRAVQAISARITRWAE
ncbi:hypothetical protein GCM10009836_12190 [Pseudonocardia ailaonensis]|uniref:ABC transmembrane type-1 domain-containing protein n=1 Tax=Pseudonocardia ailaonensis TaxID=367279 RepID=A0ABN2MQR7_9PSEU